MIMCDKQIKNLTKLEQKENFNKNTKNTSNIVIENNTIDSINNSGKNNNTNINKLNKTKSLTNPLIMLSIKSQPKQLNPQFNMTMTTATTTTSTTATRGVECSQQQQEQTIISKVLNQKVSMTQQANKQTHMTLKEFLEYTNDVAATAPAAAAKQTATALATIKRINKQKYAQQQQQQQQQNKQQINLNSSNYNNNCVLSTLHSCEQHQQHQQQKELTNTSDPTAIVPNMSTTYTHLPPAPTAQATKTTRVQDTETAATTTTATTTVFPAIEAVENSQSKIQQCDNVCIHSKYSSKQKCIHQQQKQKTEQRQQQQQQQQHHQHLCKSANVCSSNKNSNIINKIINNHTSSNKTNITTDITVTAAATTTTITNKVTNNSNNNNTTTTTNKANNISSNTETSTLHHCIITTKQQQQTSRTATTTPIPCVAAAAAITSADCKAFPLRRFCNNMKQLECLLRTLLFSFMFIMSMQYQTVSASTSMLSKHEPMFISRSETFKFVAGDTIVLPCEVSNTDPYVVAWKRGIAILTAGSVKVTPDPRVRLINGFNLQIRDAVPQDAGDYICQIATMEPREITHTVEILVPPRIHHISTSGHLQVKKGSSVRIECSASGNPTPNVTWSRKNNILPNGEEKLHSHILSIENVDRHKGGVYICTANNGVGQPASSQVVLHVLYPPEITVERPVVFSGEGHEAMLVCIVHGETQPEVIWFKDTMQLDTTERHIMENRGSRHTLIIRKVHPQDFGNYSCVAENQLGKSRKTLQLSGKPNVAVFNSPPISQYKDRYNITWTVESHTPIEEYKLSFRRLQQGQEVDNSIDSHASSSSSSSSSMLQMYGNGGIGGSGSGGSSSSMMGVNAHNYRLGGISSIGSMGSGGYGSYGAGNVIHWGRNDWRDVVLPAIPTSHHYTQGMSYMIRGLDPDQHYEATVQARNRYGWSDYSQSFVFSTSSNDGPSDLSTYLNHGHLSDNEMRDLSVTFYGSKSSRIETKNLFTILLLALIVCVTYF